MSECCQSRHDGERVPAYSTWAGIQHLLTLLTVADAWVSGFPYREDNACVPWIPAN